MAAELRDVLDLLQECGAERLVHGHSHYKFRLPNRKLFTMSMSVSCKFGYTKAMKELKKQLRDTHPQLAERLERGTLAKNKRHTTNSIAEALSSRVNQFSAIPGSEPVPPPEADFEVADPAPEPAAPETFIHHAPRKVPIDIRPRPGTCKTLSQEQLDVANQILLSKGPSAMDAYINEQRAMLVRATPAIIEERFAVAEHVPPKTVLEDDADMSGILERARRELELTTSRIEQHQTIIATEQSALDTDVLKQANLEQYIKEHEILASKAALLLELLPPEELPKPALMPPVKEEAKKTRVRKEYRYPKLPYGIADIRSRVLPILRRRGGAFGSDEIISAVRESGLTPVGDKVQMYTWICAEVRSRNSEIRRSSEPARFEFKQQSHADAIEERELLHA